MSFQTDMTFFFPKMSRITALVFSEILSDQELPIYKNITTEVS